MVSEKSLANAIHNMECLAILTAYIYVVFIFRLISMEERISE